MKSFLVAACIVLTLPTVAEAADRYYPAQGRSVGGVLLVHGGGFYLNLGQAWSTGGPHATFTARHLDALVVDYPTHGVAAELRYVEARLRWLKRAEHGKPVVAYGESAGGTLAAMLAVRREVTAVAVDAPPTDLLTWPAIPGFWATQVPTTTAARIRYSPALHATHAIPLLVMASPSDTMVPYTQGTALAHAAHARLVRLTGNHLQDHTAPVRAARWLNALDNRQTRAYTH